MIELPPLPSLPIYGRDDQEDLCALVGAVEARERIMLARIAELEADAARWAWLRDNAAHSLSLTKDDHKICYETAAQRIEIESRDEPSNTYSGTPHDELERMAAIDSIWSVYVYPNTPVGHNSYHGATLDAAIDAAMKGAKP